VSVLSRGEDLALLMGRLFVAALFLPSGFHKLMTFSAYAASLKAKGLPLAALWAGVLVAAEVLGPLALIIGAWPRWTALTLVAFAAVTLWLSHRASFAGALFRPRQNADLYRTLAIMGGLLFYFASGPGAWSWKGSSAGRAAKG
jgi:putative oxidoreductase